MKTAIIADTSASEIQPVPMPQGVGVLRPMGLLLPLLRPYRWRLAGGVAAMLLSSVMMLTVGWGLKEIVDFGFGAGSAEFLDKSLVILLAVVGVMALASYARLMLVHMTAERVVSDLRRRIYAHLLTLDARFFDDRKTADHISRINTDTTVLQMVLTTNLPSVFRHTLMLAGGVVMLCVVSPVMTGVVLLAVPLVIVPMILFGRRVRAKSRETQGEVAGLAVYAQETLQAVQTVQAYGYEGRAQSRFAGLSDGVVAMASRYIAARAVMTAFVIFMVMGAICLVLWYGGHQVLTGGMTAGDLSAFIFYAMMVAGAVAAIAEAGAEFNRAGGAADRLTELMSAASALPFRQAEMPAGVPAAVSFDNVTFSYPTRPEARALDGFSLDVAAGEVVAIVGRSGAGKTTVFQLLQRFYDPQAGRVAVGGVDIRDVAPAAVRSLFGVVAQEPVIFSLSVADNIRIAKPDASDAEVRRAAEQAQADSFIRALPQGYDTEVGERGNRLSGGQRQRIAIARAILKDPRILLLDEATSALDAENEQAVHAALAELMKGRTTIVIAHRLSTVRGADRIVVMDHGRAVASGSHDALYAEDGIYRHLAGLQLG